MELVSFNFLFLSQIMDRAVLLSSAINFLGNCVLHNRWHAGLRMSSPLLKGCGVAGFPQHKYYGQVF